MVEDHADGDDAALTHCATQLLIVAAICAGPHLPFGAPDCLAQGAHGPGDLVERLPPVHAAQTVEPLAEPSTEPESEPYQPVFRGPGNWESPGGPEAGFRPPPHEPGFAEVLMRPPQELRGLPGENAPGLFPPLMDPAGSPAQAAQGPPGGEWFGRRGRLWAEACELKCKIVSDHRNFYSWPTGRDFALGLGLGAVLANTSLDQDFRDWYQDDVRSSGTDDFSSFCKVFGEGQIFIPAFAGLALLEVFCENVPLLGTVGSFSDRVTRAYLVGAPPMLLMQLVTGASRPGEAPYDSRWSPFEDNNGVSGHAFMGAAPFITAAQMCENPWLKGGLYACSTLTAWSRVNDDRHYLSQAWLGWWMAYLACRAVDQTAFDERHMTLVPIASPEVVGVGLVISR